MLPRLSTHSIFSTQQNPVSGSSWHAAKSTPSPPSPPPPPVSPHSPPPYRACPPPPSYPASCLPPLWITLPCLDLCPGKLEKLWLIKITNNTNPTYNNYNQDLHLKWWSYFHLDCDCSPGSWWQRTDSSLIISTLIRCLFYSRPGWLHCCGVVTMHSTAHYTGAGEGSCQQIPHFNQQFYSLWAPHSIIIMPITWNKIHFICISPPHW